MGCQPDPRTKFQERSIGHLIGFVFALIIAGIGGPARAIDEHPVIPRRATQSEGSKPAAVPAKPNTSPPTPAAPTPVTVSLIFTDASTLKNLMAGGTENSEQVWARLKAYHVTPASIKNNPFLRDITYLTHIEDVAVSITAPNQLQGLAAASPWSAGGVADLLGTLIAQRFKEEAELLALQDLARTMTDKRNAKLVRSLTAGMPRTMNYIGTVAPDTLDLRDWAILQSDFKVDVAALPDNLPSFFDVQFDSTSRPDRRYFVSMAATAVIEVNHHGRSPYVVLDAIQQKSAKLTCPGEPCDTVRNFDAGLAFVDIASHMLTRNASTMWYSARDLEFLIGYDPTSEIFDATAGNDALDNLRLLLGLSYAVDKPLYDKLDIWLEAHHQVRIADWDKSRVDATAQMIAQLMVGLAAAYEDFQKQASGVPNPVTTVEDLEPLIGGLKSLGSSLGMLAGNFTNTSVDTATLMAVAQRLDSIIDIVGDIKSKAYPAAMGETLHFVQTFIVENPSNAQSDPVFEFFRVTGPFIAEVAAAKTPAAAETALQNFALPAGSYMRVQNEPLSVTFNAYFGVTTGAETLLGNLTGTGTARTRAHLGFTAPVGLAVNWGQVNSLSHTTTAGTGGGFFQTGSWSLFVPVLDVGAVASWRLGSGGGQVSSITWANIVAPGLYVVWTKKNTPFSIMIGAQYGPELTKVSTGGSTTIERAALQFPSIQFTFDIPIAFLYQNPKWQNPK